jgi:hypothetical protein
MSHFHILWSNSKLDWERFDSREEARRGAEVLVRLGETYTIEQFDDDCPRCRQFAEKYRNQTEPETKYPWQKLVFEALRETDAAKLAAKINAAEQAIAQRLCLRTLHLEEHAAIQGALRVLRVLIEERKAAAKPGEKKESRNPAPALALPFP